MAVEQIIYTSEISDVFNYEDIGLILSASKENNADLQVTGALSFVDSCFIQLLEGEKTKVNRLYSKIQNDPRHNNILIRHYGPSEKRLFSEWSMLNIDREQITTTLLGKEDTIEQYILSITSYDALGLFQKLSGLIQSNIVNE